MDPDANIQEQNRIRARMRDGRRAGRKIDSDERSRLQELREALAEWIRNGGFRPKVRRAT